MANLYEIASDYLLLLDIMSNDELEAEELKDTLEGVEGELEIKAENYAKIMKNIEGDIKALKEEEKRLSTRRKALEKNVERLKQALFNVMKETGKTKFKTELFNFSICKNGGKLPVIVDVETSYLPDELVKIVESPDLEAISRLLDAGDFTYAHYGERGESLRIR